MTNVVTLRKEIRQYFAEGKPEEELKIALATVRCDRTPNRWRIVHKKLRRGENVLQEIEEPESYRRLVLPRYYGGRSCSEVAEQLDIPLGTVTRTLSRAYAMLRKSLQQPSETESCEVQK